jgi:hypothetical protein
MTCCNRAAGGVFNRIISPGQDVLQHKDPNGGTQRPNAMAPRTLEWHEARGAVDFGQQLRLGAESVSLPLWFSYFLMMKYHRCCGGVMRRQRAPARRA